MKRFHGVGFVPVLLALSLAACAPAHQEDAMHMAPAPAGATCDTASASVTALDSVTALSRAEAALDHQSAELKGDLFASGVRRIRVAHSTSRCEAAGLGAGPMQCTVVAQLCGR